MGDGPLRTQYRFCTVCKSRICEHMAKGSIVQIAPRERQVLRWLVQGQSNKEIADAIGISEQMVKLHLSKLFAKLRLTSRFELAMWGVK